MPKKRGELRPDYLRVGEDPSNYRDSVVQRRNDKQERSAENTDARAARQDDGLSYASDHLPPVVPAPIATPARSSSSFGARFGRVILSHGIAVIPTALYHF